MSLIFLTRDGSLRWPYTCLEFAPGPGTNRFDHHQRGFEEIFGHGFATKLSSAGLVYKHYGKQIVAALVGLPADHPDVHTVYLAVYKSFMEGIDAIDNGAIAIKFASLAALILAP